MDPNAFPDAPGVDSGIQGVPGGDRPFDEVARQYGALDQGSKVACLAKSDAVRQLKLYGPSYEQFVEHFKAHRNEMRFFLGEARASAKSLQDKFVHYIDDRLQGNIRFDSIKATDLNAEISKSGLPTARKLKRIAKAVIDSSHDGFENLPQARDALVSCLQEVHKSLMRDHDMKGGNNLLRNTIDRLKNLKVASLSTTRALAESDQYLAESVADLKQTLDQLFALYDILMPGFFSHR